MCRRTSRFHSCYRYRYRVYTPSYWLPWSAKLLSEAKLHPTIVVSAIFALVYHTVWEHKRMYTYTYTYTYGCTCIPYTHIQIHVHIHTITHTYVRMQARRLDGRLDEWMDLLLRTPSHCLQPLKTNLAPGFRKSPQLSKHTKVPKLKGLIWTVHGWGLRIIHGPCWLEKGFGVYYSIVKEGFHKRILLLVTIQEGPLDEKPLEPR